jgi:hypothetical protein
MFDQLTICVRGDYKSRFLGYKLTELNLWNINFKIIVLGPYS